MSWNNNNTKKELNLAEMPTSLSTSKAKNLTDVPTALKQTNKYRCTWEGCGKECTRKYNLSVHMRMHTGEAPYTCERPGCKMRFKWKSSLVHHQRSHTGETDGKQASAKYADRLEERPFQRNSSFSGHFSRKDNLTGSGSGSGSASGSGRSESFAESPRCTPLDTPLVTVSSFENFMNEHVEDSSFQSLLSFDLSQDDISEATGLTNRLEANTQGNGGAEDSATLDRIVLEEGDRWRS